MATFWFRARRLPCVCPLLLLALLLGGAAIRLGAEGKPAAPADELTLLNGDHITGKMVRAIGDSVVFHHDVMGDLTIPWAKIKELKSDNRFVVISKNGRLTRNMPESVLPMGRLDVEDQAIHLAPPTGPATQPIPVKSAALVLDQTTFENQLLHEPGPLHGWTGSATLGATLVQATQNTSTVSGGIALVRAVPSVDYLPPRNRSTADFSFAYGKNTQPGTPDIKTALWHADAERDQYISSRLYALGMVAFDHNFSQLLDLQQIYGGGIGYTVIKSPRQQLDVKGTIQYEKQSFLTDYTAVPPVSSPSIDLIGSTFNANYTAHLPRGTVFNQQLSFIPSYNTPRAYTASEVDSLAFPVYKGFSFSVGSLDTYLNSAPAGSKRNSFQFTAGVAYAIK